MADDATIRKELQKIKNFKIESSKDVPIKAFIAISKIEKPNYSDIVEHLTGVDRKYVENCSLDWAYKIAEGYSKAIQEKPVLDQKHRVGDYQLTTFKELYKSIHTDMTLGQFFNMVELRRATDGLKSDGIVHLPKLLACVYKKPNEVLTEANILERAEWFENNASLYDVWQCFFLQMSVQVRFLRFIKGYLKVLQVLEKLIRTPSLLLKKLTTG